MTARVIHQAAVGALIAGLALTVALATGVGSPAAAATPPIGSFPVWTQPTSYTFIGQLAPAVGGGTIAVSTTAANARIAETGQQAFLGAQTGFGQKFGSSRYQSYLTIGLAPTVPPATHGADSVTTVTLPALPVGWGFAVGDIDADMVTIGAVGGGSGGGGALTAAELNPQDTGGVPKLNYCDNASPKPSGCGAGTSFTDAPWWCPVPAAAPCNPAAPPLTVVGNGVDTAGAYDWFVPTVSVTTLTLTYQWLSGIPSFQLWIIAPAPAATVDGKVDLSTGAPAPADTTLGLEHADGTPVLDVTNAPVTVAVAADGSFSFATELGDYRLTLDPPTGYQVADPTAFPLAFTASADTLDLGTLTLSAQLAATGTDSRATFALASGLLAAGIGFTVAATVLRRRRTPRAQP
ncbi:MAG: hypothetical protein ABJA11_05480 [Pseudolysinimonas sp.]